jgi:hypothetical protein
MLETRMEDASCSTTPAWSESVAGGGESGG